MGTNEREFEFETERLAQTVAFAGEKLEQAKKRNEDNESAILAAKEDMRDNASHSISSLWSSDGFEALAELSQYASQVTAKIDQFESTEKEIAQLEQAVQTPYFARIDFQFDGESQFEKVYIGRSSLMEEETFDMYVYDWRSPIASVFYRFTLGQAFYEAPAGRIAGEVSLKRQFEIKQSKLNYFFDADIQIIDEFLRKLLSQNTSPKMKTIVETIQKEQDLVIRDMENELMMVQGVAGSGKTSIALHRAAYLMYQDLAAKLSANNIIIISPNTLFEQYISKVLPELGEENVVTAVFEKILSKVLKTGRIQSRNQFLEYLINSPRYREIRKRSIEFKTSPLFKEILQRFLADIPERWVAFEDIYYKGKKIVTKKMLKERVLSLAGRTDIKLGLKLEKLRDFVRDSIDQAEEHSVSKGQVARILEEMGAFIRLDVRELYQKMIKDRRYFYSLAAGLPLPEGIEEILKFTSENLNSDMLYYDDAIAIAYLRLNIYDNNAYTSIKQVVIDEAQDYYPMQFEIFKLLFGRAKYTVLGDVNQTLEKQEDLSLYEKVSAILDKKKSSLVTMDKSFRSTNEIFQFSAKFLESGLEVKSFNREGEDPEVHVAPDQETLLDMLAAEVKLCREKGYQSIGLIVKSERNAHALHSRLEGRVNAKLIKNNSAEDLEGVFIIPVYMAKGLEFDAVLVCDADAENYHNSDDKKLLYVACTRALHRLNLFCEGQASPLL